MIVPKASQAAKNSSNFQRMANIYVVEAAVLRKPVSLGAIALLRRSPLITR
jgi:hypothetical protein